MKKWVVILFAIAAVGSIVFLAGCGKGSGEEAAAENGGTSAGSSGPAVISDFAGRDVEIDLPAERVCAIGPGSLRLVCYVGAQEKVVGIENMEKNGRPEGRIFMHIRNSSSFRL